METLFDGGYQTKFSANGMIRAMQKIMISCFYLIGTTRTKWIIDIGKRMPKFMFVQMAKANPYSRKQYYTFWIVTIKYRIW